MSPQALASSSRVAHLDDSHQEYNHGLLFDISYTAGLGVSAWVWMDCEVLGM